MLRQDAADGNAEYYDLLQSLEHFNWLKLPFECMRECGPAVQTLGGLLRITGRQTFVSTEAIADRAYLPRRTVQKHLRTLDAAGWVECRGRERTPAGRLRRTATTKIAGRARKCEHFGILPEWARVQIKHEYLTWSSKAILSVVMARTLAIQRGNEVHELETLDDVLIHSDDRFSFSLSYLQKTTGLGRSAIVDAKAQLSRTGLVRWTGDPSEYHASDLLAPSLRVAIKRWQSKGEYWFTITKNPEWNHAE